MFLSGNGLRQQSQLLYTRFRYFYLILAGSIIEIVEFLFSATVLINGILLMILMQEELGFMPLKRESA